MEEVASDEWRVASPKQAERDRLLDPVAVNARWALPRPGNTAKIKPDAGTLARRWGHKRRPPQKAAATTAKPEVRMCPKR
jgi:hypothetical protein